MRPGLFRDALLVAAPCTAVLAGLASIDHRQRLVEAGYRLGALEREGESLTREVEHRRAVVAGLASPVRLLAEARRRDLRLDFPIQWNRVEGGEEAQRLIASRKVPTQSRTPGKAKAGTKAKTKAKAQATAEKGAE